MKYSRGPRGDALVEVRRSCALELSDGLGAYPPVAGLSKLSDDEYRGDGENRQRTTRIRVGREDGE